MSYPWRQRIIPRTWRPTTIPQATICKLTGLQCQLASCPRFIERPEYSRGFEDCDHREAEKS